MPRCRWQMKTRLAALRLPGGFALVWLVLVFMGIVFEAGDRPVLRWIADINVFPLEENRDEPLQGTREMHGTDAYLQQFEHPAGAQWLPHSY